MFGKTFLLGHLDAYRALCPDLRESALSHRIFQDTKVIANLRGSADITLGRYEMALRWLASHWPDGHDLPPDLAQFVAATPTPDRKDDAA